MRTCLLGIVMLMLWILPAPALSAEASEETKEPADGRDHLPPVEASGTNGGVSYAGSREEGFRLTVDGEPFLIKGAGYMYPFDMDLIRESGGNTIRTWASMIDGNSDYLGRILDDADAAGLKVIAGLWVPHQRHGFSYGNSRAVAERLEMFRQTVIRYRGHPALLMWGIGNEYTIGMTDSRVFDFVNRTAEMIHRECPGTPTLTVLPAGDVNEEMLRTLDLRMKEVDILGVNAYGSLPFFLERMETLSWDKPVIVTEWGHDGYWEVPRTSWGAPLEQPSGVKQRLYLERYALMEEKPWILGSCVFYWGWKQERTHTFFNLLTQEGIPTENVDALQYLWTGEWPENRAPHVTGIRLEDGGSSETLHRGERCVFRVEASDPEGDALEYHWEIYPESDARSTGGDFEESLEALWERDTAGAEAEIPMPGRRGAYRVFVTVTDSRSGRVGYANFPVRVR